MEPNRQEPAQRMVIDGQTVAVFKRRPPLPPRLDALLASPGMRAYPLKITGWRPDCGQQNHRAMLLIAEGRYRGPDMVLRDLRVLMCPDCESVCVRDVSIDQLEAHDPTGRGLVRPSRLAPRRRDHVIAWYSGARRNQRLYR